MHPLETLYEETRGRIKELVAPFDTTAVETPVAACPGWSVKDVVAHLAGNGADLLAGNIVGVATADWTAAQVEHRRDWKLGDVLAEWDDVGPKFAAMLDDFPGQYGRMTVSDLVVHEQDLRGTLGLPGARDSDALTVGMDFAIGVVAFTGALVHGLGPLEMRGSDDHWLIGTGDKIEGNQDSWRETAGADTPPAPSTSQPVGRVVTDRFELFRAVTGRRSAEQIRAFEWSVDPDPYLPLFGYGPFDTRAEDLEE